MPISRLTRDRRGSVAVTVALGATVVFGCTALGIDLGTIFAAKRRIQGAADLAAMIAASDPGRADPLARQALADNGFGSDATIAVTPGRYRADRTLVPEQRFQPAATPPNAVRVALSSAVRTNFAPVIGLPAAYDVGATGTAASAQLAAFTIGSRLVGLDGGIANAVLGALLGTRLTLNVMDYRALVSTQVDSYGLLNALGAKLQLASFDDVLNAEVSAQDVLVTLRALSRESGASEAAAALDALIAAGSSGTRFKVGDLIDLGDAGQLAPQAGTRGPPIALMDTISAAASLANGRRQISVDLGANLPGLLRTRLTVAIGERRQSSGWVQPDTPSATVKTAQARILLETSLTAPLGLGTITLPLYVQAAYARGTLRSVSCPWSASARRQVAIEATPGAVDLAIANVTASSISNDAPSPDLSRDAALIQLPLLSVTGKSRVAMAAAQPTRLVFDETDIAEHRVKTVSSTGMTQSMTQELLGSLSLNLSGLALTPLLRPALQLTLAGVAPVLDMVLDNTLRVLGIRVGSVDVTVDGTRCDHAVLVQ